MILNGLCCDESDHDLDLKTWYGELTSVLQFRGHQWDAKTSYFGLIFPTEK